MISTDFRFSNKRKLLEKEAQASKRVSEVMNVLQLCAAIGSRSQEEATGLQQKLGEKC